MAKLSNLEKVKLNLVFDQPFFATLLLSMPIIVENGIPTMATDGKYVYYNEKFVESLTEKELMGVFVHEVLHIKHLHHLRKENRNHLKWNVATDYVVNLEVVAMGFTLPKDILYDTQFNGKFAEQVYNMIPDIPINYVNIGGVNEPKHEDGTPLSEGERKQLEKEVEMRVTAAYNVAKKQGKLPADAERWIREILEPKVNWKEYIQQFIAILTKNDYSWNKPNRRYIGGGVYFPTLHKPEVGTIVAGFDTSGSMSEKEIAEVGAELNAIMQSYVSELYVIYTDAKVAEVQRFEEGDIVELKPKGGGGTMYSPTFNYVEKKRIEPSCLIYFTDGYCSDFPKVEPEYSVLWVLTEKNPRFKPKFGEVITLR